MLQHLTEAKFLVRRVELQFNGTFAKRDRIWTSSYISTANFMPDVFIFTYGTQKKVFFYYKYLIKTFNFV